MAARAGYRHPPPELLQCCEELLRRTHKDIGPRSACGRAWKQDKGADAQIDVAFDGHPRAIIHTVVGLYPLPSAQSFSPAARMPCRTLRPSRGRARARSRSACGVKPNSAEFGLQI